MVKTYENIDLFKVREAWVKTNLTFARIKHA